MYRGRICERSLGHTVWWTVLRRVYKNSLIGTLALAYMIETHKRRGTWNTNVTRFIVPTQFVRSIFVNSGLQGEKVIVKPNFVTEQPGQSNQGERRRTGALFVGRLSPEKGVAVLFDAWEKLK